MSCVLVDERVAYSKGAPLLFNTSLLPLMRFSTYIFGMPPFRQLPAGGIASGFFDHSFLSFI